MARQTVNGNDARIVRRCPATSNVLTDGPLPRNEPRNNDHPIVYIMEDLCQ